ncbi:hypothetical protein GG344DRAFT_71169 [Lentinula edodes]|nr:hypothetical protein GG344DRAFT_71169 [Lentinula edodes]
MNAQNVTITFIWQREELPLKNTEMKNAAAAYAKMSVLLLLDAASSELGLSGIPYNVRFTAAPPYPDSKLRAEKNGFALSMMGIPAFQGGAPLASANVTVSAKSEGNVTIEYITGEFYTWKLVPHKKSPFWTRMHQFADYLKDWDPKLCCVVNQKVRKIQHPTYWVNDGVQSFTKKFCLITMITISSTEFTTPSFLGWNRPNSYLVHLRDDELLDGLNGCKYVVLDHEQALDGNDLVVLLDYFYGKMFFPQNPTLLLG